MTKDQRDLRESAIRHIQTSCDIDDWAMELATEALSVDFDVIIDQMRALYKDSLNGAAGEYVRGWDNAIDACIAVLRGMEGVNENRG